MRTKDLHKDFKLNGFTFNTIAGLLKYVEPVSKESHLFFEEWFDEKDYVVVQTSGSTGSPKSIQLSKDNMKNSAMVTGTFFKLPESTKALLCMSPNYIAGKMMLVRALVLGWELDIVAPVSNPLEYTQKEYDFSAMVPMQVEGSLNSLNQIKKLIVGGGVVSSVLQKSMQLVDTEIFATYGMTETITHIAAKRLNRFELQDKNEVSSNIDASYETLPDVEISLDDRGCLMIDAPNLSKERIITNDLVSIVSKNKFNWLGRIDNVINSGGVKLIPEQIEKKIQKMINYRCFVTGMKNDRLGEKLVLIVESDTLFDKMELLESLKSNSLLSNFEVPKEIFILKSFVETATKKINRTASIEKLNASTN